MNDKDLAAAYKKQRDELLKFIQHAPVSSGVCCCGDDMKNHSSPMICGHSPVDMWDDSVYSWAEQIAKLDADTMTTDDPEYTVVNPPGPPLTDKELISILQYRAGALRTAGRESLAQYLESTAREIRVYNERLHVNTITSSHNVEDYAEWLRAGAMLKATGYDHAFRAWRNWSEKSPKYDWKKLNEAWVSFPRALEPEA